MVDASNTRAGERVETTVVVTVDDMQGWLEEGGGPWVITAEADQITEAAWIDAETRVHYLCNRANLGRFYLYDERGTNGFRTVYLAIKG